MAESDVERLEVGALSETGYVRDENQDRMSGSVVPLGHLYIVADGMGGHKAGALAAQMAVEELQRHIAAAAANDPADAVIAAAFKTANDVVYKRSHAGDSATEGMGTTAVMLLISGRVVRVAHVGDSRAYLYRNGALSQLTTDHTIVQRMVQAGMLKPEDAANHPQSSMLERAIGSSQNVEVDLRSHPLQSGDALLLCSDGLSGYVSDPQIEDVLRNERTVQETTADLVRLALDKGGRDNVTVQVIRYGPRKEAPVVRQTRPTPVLKPAAAPSGRGGQGAGAQVPRKPDKMRSIVPAAVVGVVAVVALAFFVPRLGDLTGLGDSSGLRGSNAPTPAATSSSSQPQPPAAVESPPAPTQAPAGAPKTTSAASAPADSPDALRDRLTKKEQELATTQQKLNTREQELADARKKIAELEARLKDATKAPARKPGGSQSGSQESAPKGATKPNGASAGSPAATGSTPTEPPATSATTPEKWVPAGPPPSGTPPSGTPPSAPPAPPSGTQEPPPVKPASDGG